MAEFAHLYDGREICGDRRGSHAGCGSDGSSSMIAGACMSSGIIPDNKSSRTIICQPNINIVIYYHKYVGKL